jgi:hypothetical protein
MAARGWPGARPEPARPTRSLLSGAWSRPTQERHLLDSEVCWIRAWAFRVSGSWPRGGAGLGAASVVRGARPTQTQRLRSNTTIDTAAHLDSDIHRPAGACYTTAPLAASRFPSKLLVKPAVCSGLRSHDLIRLSSPGPERHGSAHWGPGPGSGRWSRGPATRATRAAPSRQRSKLETTARLGVGPVRHGQVAGSRARRT